MTSSPSVLALPLAGHRALVTGSSGGIGAGIAKRLAAEGADVLVHYHTRRQGALDTKRAILDKGGGGSGTCVGIVQCDFRSQLAMTDMMETHVDRLWPDGFDILINNAGLITKLALDDDDEDLSVWHETMTVNLHAPLFLARLAKTRMLRRMDTADDAKTSQQRQQQSNQRSVIVNVSSIHGARSVEYMTAYAVSKAGLDALTRGLALEYAPHNINVNGVAPGIVPVERTAEALSQQETVQMWKRHLPTDRLGCVEEVAEAVLQLVTNAWLTGVTWTIDGGMMARANMPLRPKPSPGARVLLPPVSDKAQSEEYTSSS